MIVAACSLVPSATAQDPTRLLPDSYKLQFENEWVRVTRVHYPKTVKEVHEVENPSDTPSDFLRVEFKTEPLGEATLRGRFYPEAYFVAEAPPGWRRVTTPESTTWPRRVRAAKYISSPAISASMNT
jgi:hypothetical protein